VVIEVWIVATALDVCDSPEVIDGVVDKVLLAIKVVTETTDEIANGAADTTSQHNL